MDKQYPNEKCIDCHCFGCVMRENCASYLGYEKVYWWKRRCDVCARNGYVIRHKRCFKHFADALSHFAEKELKIMDALREREDNG